MEEFSEDGVHLVQIVPLTKAVSDTMVLHIDMALHLENAWSLGGAGREGSIKIPPIIR